MRIFCLLLTIFLSSIIYIYGQGIISLNVWPPRVDLTVMPGESKTGIITVTNTGRSKITVKATINDCAMGLSGNMTFPDGGTTQYTCEPWLSINPDECDLAQGGSQQVRYTLKAPSDIGGTFLANIFFQSKPTTKLDGSGVLFSARVGTLFVVDVLGQRTLQGELTSLSLAQVGKDNHPQVDLVFKNKGNTLLRPKGSIELKNETGLITEKTPFNEDGQSVLPYGERNYRVPLACRQPGRYTLTATIDYGGPEILSAETKVNLVSEPISPKKPITQKTASQTQENVVTSNPPPPDDRTPKPTVTASKPTAKPPPAKASPEEIKRLNNQATQLYAKGEYEQALAVWQKLVKIDPKNTTAKRNLEKTRGKLEALKKAR